MMSDALTTALGWKDSIESALTRVYDQFESLRDGGVDELAENISQLEADIDDAINGLPCESGIAEFVDDAQDSHDECYSVDDVAITSWDLDDHWTLDQYHLVPQRTMAELLEAMLNDVPWMMFRSTIKGLVEALDQEDYNINDGTDAYAPEPKPFLEMRLGA